MLELVLGGARSGKSRFAEQRALQTDKQRVYIATAQGGDEEMKQRILTHQSSRDTSWLTVEEPLQLAAVIERYMGEDFCILVDCLTLWITNLLLHDDPLRWREERDLLMALLQRYQER